MVVCIVCSFWRIYSPYKDLECWYLLDLVTFMVLLMSTIEFHDITALFGIFLKTNLKISRDIYAALKQKQLYTLDWSVFLHKSCHASPMSVVCMLFLRYT